MSHITNMKQIKFDHIYRGDARILASKLPNGSISVTITSPPYWNLKNYGIENQIG
jgi:site-specific DNA-methyltransferase (adenine-specific)